MTCISTTIVYIKVLTTIISTTTLKSQ